MPRVIFKEAAMYRIKKTSILTDTLEFSDGDGKLTVEFSLTLSPEIIKKYRELQLTLSKIENDPQKDLEEYGRAIVAMFALVFGAENTSKILEYYQDNYVQMEHDVVPYLRDVAIPKIQAYMRKARANMRGRKFKKWAINH